MAYCLSDTGEVIAGLKKKRLHDILCIVEVGQAVKYMGLLPRLFMRQTFSMVYGSMKQCVKR